MLKQTKLSHLFEQVLRGDCSSSQVEKFLGEVCLLLRILHRLDFDQFGSEQPVLSKIVDILIDPKRLFRHDGYFRQIESVFAYANIREFVKKEAYLEGILDVISETDVSNNHAAPYRSEERDFILYVSGRGILSVLSTCDDHEFCSCVADFSIDDCYILTHLYIYRTDFGMAGDLGKQFKAALFVVAEKAIQCGNFDLFLESYICLVNQNLTESEIAYLERCFSEVVGHLSSVIAEDNLANYYHEVILYRMSMLLRSIKSRAAFPIPAEKGRVFYEFNVSLQSKNVKKIVAFSNELVALTGNNFFYLIAWHRLSWISEMASRKILFRPEELSGNVVVSDGIYDQVLTTIAEVRANWAHRAGTNRQVTRPSGSSDWSATTGFL